MIDLIKPKRTNLSLVVAEPELQKLENVKKRLERKGNIVYTTDKASKIIEIVRVHEVDASFIDYESIDYSLEELLKEVSQIRKDILTIFFAESFTKEMMLKILSAGAFAFIEFPFDELVFDKLFSSIYEKKLLRSE